MLLEPKEWNPEAMPAPSDDLALGIQLLQSRRFAEAIAQLERVVALDPNSGAANNALGLAYLGQRRATEAIEAFQRAAVGEAMAAPIYHNLGLALQMADRAPQAMEAFRRAIELDPRHLPNYLALGQLLLQHALAEEAIQSFREGLVHQPRSIPLLLGLAKAYAVGRDLVGAERTFRKALAYDTGAAAPYGVWLQEEGRREEALAQFEMALKANPVQGFAYYELVQAGRVSPDDDGMRKRLRTLAEEKRLPPIERMYLRYALGKLHESRKEFAESMTSYDQANALAFELHKAGKPFGLVAHREFPKIELPSRSEKPILIVGMIRSGTTLLEQMLSAHSEIGAAGELRFWMEAAQRPITGDVALRYLEELERAAPDGPRVTDKMPLNFNHLGLVHAACPNAKILHLRRNPVDTCLSIWTTYFGSGPSFAYCKEHIVAYYRHYLATMEHWRSVLSSENLFELDYETLVASPEETMRTVLAFLNLPWEEACLHPEGNRSSINTPSRWQARQPVHGASVERWRRVEPWLGAFSELISDTP